MTEFTIPASELARLTHNALAFMPARSAVKVCSFMVTQMSITITATDLYTVGRDYAYHSDPPGQGDKVLPPEWIDLSREDLQTLDKAARAAKKEDVRVVVRHQDGMEYFTEDVHGTFLDSSVQRNPEDLWKRCDELLTALERENGMFIPEYLTLDPAMFNRFGKIKVANGGECIADLAINDPSEPILVKIGSTFRGAIMPVDRGEAAESDSVGPEGLWHDQKVDS